jgi:hypothetical protein
VNKQSQTLARRFCWYTLAIRLYIGSTAVTSHTNHALPCGLQMKGVMCCVPRQNTAIDVRRNSAAQVISHCSVRVPSAVRRLVGPIVRHLSTAAECRAASVVETFGRLHCNRYTSRWKCSLLTSGHHMKSEHWCVVATWLRDALYSRAWLMRVACSKVTCQLKTFVFVALVCV